MELWNFVTIVHPLIGFNGDYEKEGTKIKKISLGWFFVLFSFLFVVLSSRFLCVQERMAREDFVHRSNTLLGHFGFFGDDVNFAWFFVCISLFFAFSVPLFLFVQARRTREAFAELLGGFGGKKNFVGVVSSLCLAALCAV